MKLCQSELWCFCSHPVQAPFLEPKNLWPYFIVTSLLILVFPSTVLLKFTSTVMIKWWLSSSVTCCHCLVSSSGCCCQCFEYITEIQFAERQHTVRLLFRVLSETTVGGRKVVRTRGQLCQPPWRAVRGCHTRVLFYFFFYLCLSFFFFLSFFFKFKQGKKTGWPKSTSEDIWQWDSPERMNTCFYCCWRTFQHKKNGAEREISIILCVINFLNSWFCNI